MHKKRNYRYDEENTKILAWVVVRVDGLAQPISPNQDWSLSWATIKPNKSGPGCSISTTTKHTCNCRHCSYHFGTKNDNVTVLVVAQTVVVPILQSVLKTHWFARKKSFLFLYKVGWRRTYIKIIVFNDLKYCNRQKFYLR
jgi:hypothetical protein